jgi:hypothetical protein
MKRGKGSRGDREVRRENKRMRQKGGIIEKRRIRHMGDRKETAGRGHWKFGTDRKRGR